MKAIFLRVIEAEDKAEALKQAIADRASPLRFEVDLASFDAIARSPFAYWASERVRVRCFEELPRFESDWSPRPDWAWQYIRMTFGSFGLWNEVPAGASG